VVSRRKGDSSSRRRCVVLSCRGRGQQAAVTVQGRRGQAAGWRAAGRRQGACGPLSTHQALFYQGIHICVVCAVGYVAAQAPPPLHKAQGARRPADQSAKHGHGFTSARS
jgi:hypothetical protein